MPLFFIFLSACQWFGASVKDQTVLQINEKKISVKLFAERLAVNLKDYDALFLKDPNQLKKSKNDLIAALIVEKLIEDYAEKNKISLSNEEIDSAMLEMRKNYPNEIAFRKAFAERNLSISAWREKLSMQLLKSKIMLQFRSKIKDPLDEELKELFTERQNEFNLPARIKLRQVVVSSEDEAHKVYDAMKGGASLEQLARKYSSAPEAANGGLTDWIEKGALEVFDAAFKLPIGGKSHVVKSPYGYHIYQVIEKQPEAKLSLQNAKTRLRSLWIEQKLSENYQVWLDEQIRLAKVFKDDEAIDAIIVDTKVDKK